MATTRTTRKAKSTKNVSKSTTGFAKKGVAEGAKLIEGVVSFNKSNLEAFTQATQVATKALQNLGETIVSVQKANMALMTDATKAMQDAKSVQDVVEIQNEKAKNNLNTFVEEQTKIAETMVKVGSDIVEPLSKRVSEVVEDINTRIKD